MPDKRCDYMSEFYYRGFTKRIQCDRTQGHYPQTNHNLSEADIMAAIDDYKELNRG